MKSLIHLQEHKGKGTPITYLLYTGALYLLCLISPQDIRLNIIIALTCALIFIIRPLAGVFFLIAIHPVMSCSFDLFWTAGQPVEIITSTHIPQTKMMAPLTLPVSIYPFQIAAIIVLPSLFFHCRPFARQHTTSYYNIIITTLFFFFIWGVLVSLQAEYPFKSLFGLSRFFSIAIIVGYLIKFIDKVDILRKVMIVYCCAAVCMCFFAYYSSYYAFENISSIYSDYGLNIIQRQSLFNSPGRFNSELIAMIPGFGLGGKHEFSLYIVAGIIFSIYLLVTEKNSMQAFCYLLMILLLYPFIYYAPCKLGILGMILGVIVVTLLSPALRKYLILIVLFLMLLNIYGLIASGYLRPEHTKKMAGVTQNFQVMNNSSEFEGGMNGRKAIWRGVVKTIKQSNGFGIGADMLNGKYNHKIAFFYPHGHNIFIGLLAEYGFPAMICAFFLGVLSIRQVSPVIRSQICLQNRELLVRLSILTCFFAMLFEYNFDCFVWIPQLWIMGTLLWIPGNIAVKISNTNRMNVSLV